MKSRILLAAVLASTIVLPVCAKKDEQAKSQSSNPSSAGANGVVAYFDGQPIHLAEVDKLITGRLMKVRQEEYDLRHRALEQLLQQKLLEREAAKRGVTMPDLLKTEVEEKAAKPTADEVQKFYEKNKNQRGLKGKKPEEVKPQIERYLRNQKLAARRNDFLQGLMADAKIKVTLEPPKVKVPVPAGEPALGPADAPVTVVEFSDYQCPYCKRTHPVVERMLKEYGDKLRFIYRDFPLQFHPRALPAANAARCAGDQGKYWEYHENLWTASGDLGDDDLKKRATTLGLDMAAFNACYDARTHQAEIQASAADGAGVGVTGTPTFFINGRMLVGAKPYEEFKTVIDDELQKAGVTAKLTTGS